MTIEVRDWSVVRWYRWERLDPATNEYRRDDEPSPGTIYTGHEDAARSVYQRYADAGETVELRYQPPMIRPPEQIVLSTRATTPERQTDESSRPSERNGGVS